MEEKDYTKDRQYVGNIIIAVMTERISVKRGLLLFPKGCQDPSIHAAWHALCQNIIESYKPYYEEDPISYEDGLKGLIKRLLRFVNF